MTKIYKLLGFKETEEDKQIDLLKEFRSRYTEEQINLIIQGLIQEEPEDYFDPEINTKYNEFPEKPITNIIRLREKIKEAYDNAPEVKYEKVLRQVRISRLKDKEYIRFIYEGFCQICKNQNRHWEVVQLFLKKEKEKELEQMNLSLCPNCASEYRMLRNSDTKMQSFKKNICDINPEEDKIVQLGEKQVRFTNTHLAEIQEILKIESENKTP